MKTVLALLLMSTPLMTLAQIKKEGEAPRVKVAQGTLEGIDESGVYTFKGVPFAQPPVGDLRWKAPQPPKGWQGVREAKKFGPRPMQRAVFGDMNFRSDGMSEDCLYLNVWTPAKTGNERLPVLIYIYGGGLIAGDGSEPRYDGESLARKGIITVTLSHRLSVFGFMAHPELTKESPNKASGNYGFMDQTAAIKWIKDNIAAFGGDPNKITVAGESAGSVSVSAQMASPMAKGLITGAIGSSGSLLGTLSATTLAQGEENGAKFMTMAGAKSLADLRKMSAEAILEVTAKQGVPRFAATVDGYYFPKQPLDIFTAGEQAKVPLLVGWNSEEMNYRSILGKEEPTVENYRKAVQNLYAANAEEVLKLYPATTNEEVIKSATALAGDRFTGYSSWKWGDVHAQTSGKPVFRYFYTRPRPVMRPEMGDAVAGLAGGVIRGEAAQVNRPPAPTGAVHSADIEYAMGNLATNRVYDWQPADYKVSEIFQQLYLNFVKTGNPNGLGVPNWPAIKPNQGSSMIMIIDENTRLEQDTTRPRFQLLDKLSSRK
ncbi:carboxylesterase/lipase family protein [Telluribacter sp. SYSU D00476]|uniref:carboxylesterase/lipase family protein n=1 Tax=Telluribacter sp. SYSU D00476 TaxID=2811430 RepID=UPI001FF6BA11|nr:carboxylesterase family protein [Telluribacter sp. SYSU D00476]